MKSALVLIAHGSEDLESVTIIDVLRRGGLKVHVVSVDEDTLIHCANECIIQADDSLPSLTHAVITAA